MASLQHLLGRAEQPASARSFTSLSEVAAWLRMLPDVKGNVQMQKIKTALPILENPKKDLLRSICKAWGQDQMRNEQNLALEVIAKEFTAKVLAESNAALRRWEKI